MSRGELRESFLADGKQPAEEGAACIAGFIERARRTLDVAIYDLDVDGAASGRIVEALAAAAKRGVGVRLVHNVDADETPDAPPPPRTSPDAFAELGFPAHAVSEDGALMHHKYIVRDGEAVLSGSTNWTDDAFSREENVIVTIEGAAGLAQAYTRNFEHLYTFGHVHGSGGEGHEVTLSHNVRIRPYFSPAPLGAVAGACISRADHRLRIVSPVITAGSVLGVLAEFASREHFDLDGAYDHTQMQAVLRDWSTIDHDRWKIEAWKVVAPRLSGKRSTPWSPGSVHDFMHAKFVVSDDEFLVGSYNLSRHGETNAENVIHGVSEFHATTLAGFADEVATRYRSSAS